jgi:hypothetical protein
VRAILPNNISPKVGAPVLAGRLDALIKQLLASYPVFILLGLLAVVLLVTQSRRVTAGLGDRANDGAKR